jgi:hypothetical protein
MLVNGTDCSIVIKTSHVEKDIPYSDETLREAVSLLEEEAAIEGDGVCKVMQKTIGVTGCVVTPLTLYTAPLLLYLAMGSVGNPVFVSETRNMFLYRLNLIPTEDTEIFDLIQNRSTKNNEQLTMNNERRLYEACRVKSFELRIMRDEPIKLKLEITSERPPIVYPYAEAQSQTSEMYGTVIGERFNGDSVTYYINGKEYKNIYGITLISKKVGGTKTELWIKRALQKGNEIPAIIEEITITAQLLRTQYEHRHYGTSRITLKRLVLISDETEINAADTVIGPIRYYVAGTVQIEVFTSGGEQIP